MTPKDRMAAMMAQPDQGQFLQSEKDTSLHPDLRRRQRSDFAPFAESADHMWGQYAQGVADKRNDARAYLNRYNSGVETHPVWDERNRARKQARAATMAGREVPMPAAPAYDPALKQLAAPATEQAVEDMAPSPFAPINHGGDQGAFLQSEKDTRPWRETSERGIVHPFETSGYTGKTTWGALPRMAGGRSFETFDDIMNNRQVSEAEIVEGASDATAFMTSGGLAQMRPANSVGMFGGVRAKTADHGALAKAQAAEASGVPREQIWQDHGWFKGVDGKWRFEIDDTNSVARDGSGPAFKRGAPFEHQDFSRAYPDHRMNVHVNTSSPYEGGGLNRGKTGWFGRKKPDEAFFYGPWPDSARSAGLHETQHGIQNIEGFAWGGNYKDDRLKELPQFKEYRDRQAHIYRNEDVPDATIDEFAKMMIYNDLAGETEARAVQARRPYTTAERRARAPWLDYDVPESQQIVRFGGDGQQMSANPKQSAAASLAENVGKSAGRDLDGLGYYSAALEAAKSWPQGKGSPEQALAWLTKNGTKQAEIDTTGVGKAFAGQKQITRDDLVKYLGENRVGVREKSYDRSPLTDSELTNLRRNNGSEEDRLAAELGIGTDPSIISGPFDRTKWSRHSLDPSNPTYRETVLSLPDKSKTTDQIAKELGFGGWSSRLTPEQIAQIDAVQAKTGKPTDAFRSGHFPEPNIVGHMMSSLNKHEGKPVYTLDQIQSDWGQKLRDGGVRDEAKIAELSAKLAALRSTLGNEKADLSNAYKEFTTKARQTSGDDSNKWDFEPWFKEEKRIKTKFGPLNLLEAELHTANASVSGHPLVNTTDQWTNTTLRRGLQQAIDAEAEYMAIPSGKTVLGYNPGNEHGMETFYNQIVPKNLGNILSKLDKAGAGKQFVQQLETPSGMKGDGFSMFQITPAMREQARLGLPLFMNPATAAVAPLASNVGQSNEQRPRIEDILRRVGLPY